ncbi:DHA2 family efflux MFS transporter permease subunit [Bifidobacterium sp. ESL0682]|uniref:DHA2 family efflux MFS transporter permease subunit n=1 Tax=Bifidobacterium sp. ESL0682 TaxID=2983212 RepID=UPI0023F6859A|nr:DHA2 family efflux MFS transporter permease subunit [Bifidobacterium sp. ESL0682]WEV42105.1 DHA2 family efflux MFS transporter permease subunit [Bifidobacterium sp. ESL0682]
MTSQTATSTAAPQQSGKIPGKVFGSFISAGLLSLSGVTVETAMNVTFPTLMKEFNISTDTVQWMTTANLLIISIIVPLSAMLKSRFRTKSLFVTANLTFLAGLILDIFAPNFPLLLTGRVIQGVGAGIALPLMFNIILETAPPQKIGMMMGLGTLLTAVAPAIGPTFGGLVVSTTSWRVIFVCLLPIVLISLVLGIINIDQKSEIRRVSFNIPSIILIALTFGGLIYGFSSMTTKPLLSLHVAGAIVVGIIALVLFCMLQLKIDNPIIDIRTLRNLRFSGFVLAFFLLQAVSLGLSFILPNYLQLADHSSALAAGLTLLPGAALGAVFAPLGGRILDAIGPKPPLIFGGACAIIAVICMFAFGHHLSAPVAAGFYLIYMLGIGLSSGNIMTTGLSHLSAHEQSMGNAIFNTAQQFAGAVGTSIAAAILAAGQATTTNVAAGTATGATMAFGVLLVALVVEFADILRSLF